MAAPTVHRLMSGKFFPLIKFEKNSLIWWEEIRKLRNLEEVQSGFITSAEISRQEQEEYMREHEDKFFVATYNNSFVGYIGVIEDDIRFCVHPSCQGKGVGTFLLMNILKYFPNAEGRVKKSNFASIKCFNNSGVPYTLIDD